MENIMENFKVNDYAWKTITEDGHLSYYSGRYEINYSSILTKLIQETGRFCESFASDLFIDWQAVTRCIDTDAEINETFLFGLREYGVDHKEYVISRFENDGRYWKHNYRALYRLDITADGKDITMTLGRVF